MPLHEVVGNRMFWHSVFFDSRKKLVTHDAPVIFSMHAFGMIVRRGLHKVNFGVV